MMSDVLTIFNNGTGFHRNCPFAEIVSCFGRAMYSGSTGPDGGVLTRGANEYEDYIITDGPGSNAWEDPYNLMPGKWSSPFDAKALEREREGFYDKDGKNPPPCKKHKDLGMFGSFKKAVQGQIQGKGWEQNVKHVLSYLQWRKGTLDGLPKTINMIGWSRGAVTCFRLAYRLYHLGEKDVKWDNLTIESDPAYQRIKINIFAIDPVAGPGNRGTAWNRNIHPNVKHLVITYALHDCRAGFAPQDLTKLSKDDLDKNESPLLIANEGETRLNIIDDGITQFLMLPFPGKHEGHVKRHQFVAGINEDVNCTEKYFNMEEGLAETCMAGPGKIVWHLAYAFLTTHGTVFKPKKEFTTIVDGEDKESINVFEMMEEELSQDTSDIFQMLLDWYTYTRIYMHVFLKYQSNERVGKGYWATTFTGAGIKWRAINSELDKYTRYPGFFVNDHHRWLMMKLYPDCYQDIVRIAEGVAKLKRLDAEVEPEEDDANETFRSLYDKFIEAGRMDTAAFLQGFAYKADPSEDPEKPVRTKGSIKKMEVPGGHTPPWDDHFLDAAIPKLFGEKHRPGREMAEMLEFGKEDGDDGSEDVEVKYEDGTSDMVDTTMSLDNPFF